MTTELEEVLAYVKHAADCIKPIITLGDDDSIHLTDYQRGYKDALMMVVELPNNIEFKDEA